MIQARWPGRIAAAMAGQPSAAILPSDFVFTATLQRSPFLRGHPLGSCPFQRQIGLICRIEEREFTRALVKDGRGLI